MLARPPRLERGTLCLEGRCSIQLSYERTWLTAKSVRRRQEQLLTLYILAFYPPRIQAKQDQARPASNWQKTSYTNVVRYLPSGVYYARLRVGGKLVWRSLETSSATVAKLKVLDAQKQERAKLLRRGQDITVQQALLARIKDSRPDGQPEDSVMRVRECQNFGGRTIPRGWGIPHAQAGRYPGTPV
jgi:hypothetical protein